MSWLLPLPREIQDRQLKEWIDRRERANKERELQAQRRVNWLAQNTCPHCNQHPPIPPWIQDGLSI